MIEEEIPSVREELERKTVDVLTSLVYRCRENRLDKSTLGAIATALWNATSGLVGNEVSEICVKVASEGLARPMTRNFIAKGEVLTVIWNADKAGYIIFSRNATTLERHVLSRKNTEIGHREAELSKLFNALVAKGYLEII